MHLEQIGCKKKYPTCFEPDNNLSPFGLATIDEAFFLFYPFIFFFNGANINNENKLKAKKYWHDIWTKLKQGGDN